MHLAKREDFHFGCKLVRGAYMDQERKRAEAIGYPDPINVNYNVISLVYVIQINMLIFRQQLRCITAVWTQLLRNVNNADLATFQV